MIILKIYDISSNRLQSIYIYIYIKNRYNIKKMLYCIIYSIFPHNLIVLIAFIPYIFFEQNLKTSYKKEVLLYRLLT